jgi:hypothetical protein
MLGRTDANRYFLVVETQKEPSMRFTDSIFASLLEPINRRQFQTVVDGLEADAYDKSFKSWDHLVALIYAQLSGAEGLRGLVAGFNANPHHHYHLGTDKLSRSTLSDANARRPTGIFAQVFAMLSASADRQTRREGAEMVRLIDQNLQVGQMEWTHSRHEAARRLRSSGRCSELRRDHTRQCQRRRDRPPSDDQGRHDICI